MTKESDRDRAADRVMAVLPLFRHAIRHHASTQGSRQSMENWVLQLFSQNGDQCMSGVCRTRFISKPCPTSIVDALIAAGHVEARREAADRRLVRIARGENGGRHPGQGAADPRQRLLVRLGALGEAEVALLATSLEDPAHALARVGEDRERTQ